MTIFPEIYPIPTESEVDSRIHRSFLFSEKEKVFPLADGSPVELSEKDAIEGWFRLLIHTPRDAVDIYQGTDFGVDVTNIIGHRSLPRGFLESEFERQIKEAAKLNPAVRECMNFAFQRTKNGLEIEFDVVLKNKDVLGVSVTHGL